MCGGVRITVFNSHSVCFDDVFVRGCVDAGHPRLALLFGPGPPADVFNDPGIYTVGSGRQIQHVQAVNVFCRLGYSPMLTPTILYLAQSCCIIT